MQYCLANGPSVEDGRSTICVLPKGHADSHQWYTFEVASNHVGLVPAIFPRRGIARASVLHADGTIED